MQEGHSDPMEIANEIDQQIEWARRAEGEQWLASMNNLNQEHLENLERLYGDEVRRGWFNILAYACIGFTALVAGMTVYIELSKTF